jgi:hypothetical protein
MRSESQSRSSSLARIEEDRLSDCPSTVRCLRPRGLRAPSARIMPDLLAQSADRTNIQREGKTARDTHRPRRAQKQGPGGGLVPHAATDRHGCDTGSRVSPMTRRRRKHQPQTLPDCPPDEERAETLDIHGRLLRLAHRLHYRRQRIESFPMRPTTKSLSPLSRPWHARRMSCARSADPYAITPGEETNTDHGRRQSLSQPAVRRSFWRC